MTKEIKREGDKKLFRNKSHRNAEQNKQHLERHAEKNKANCGFLVV